MKRYFLIVRTVTGDLFYKEAKHEKDFSKSKGWFPGTLPRFRIDWENKTSGSVKDLHDCPEGEMRIFSRLSLNAPTTVGGYVTCECLNVDARSGE